MGNGTSIGGPTGPPQPATINTPDVETTTTASSSSTAEPKLIHEDPHAAAKTNTALKQNAIETKGQRNVAGDIKQKELNEKLAGPPRTIQAGDNPVELSKVNVQRDKTQEGGEITRYPNGVTRERSKDSSVNGFGPPPGGSTEVTSDGRMIARDAKRREVASVDKDGTMHVKTKHGEYTESPDGKVTFVTREKTNPADSRKPGTIPSNKYEDYGISTDGKTFRFPNGIEFNKDTRRITVPVEYYGGFKEHGNAIGQRTGFGPGGRELYKVERDGLYVRTREGTFKVSADDKISFEPNK